MNCFSYENPLTVTAWSFAYIRHRGKCAKSHSWLSNLFSLSRTLIASPARDSSNFSEKRESSWTLFVLAHWAPEREKVDNVFSPRPQRRSPGRRHTLRPL